MNFIFSIIILMKGKWQTLKKHTYYKRYMYFYSEHLIQYPVSHFSIIYTEWYNYNSGPKHKLLETIIIYFSKVIQKIQYFQNSLWIIIKISQFILLPAIQYFLHSIFFYQVYKLINEYEFYNKAIYKKEESIVSWKY